tara:strand:- start:272 stop:769 length:498 start_codon:yes stop_codon:yes gene_type:complete
MAKKLKEIQKAFENFQDKVDKHTDALWRINTNFWTHNGMLFEGLDALDERISALKKQGKQGVTVADFLDDAEVKAFVDGIDQCKKSCRRESDSYYAEVDKLSKVKSDLEKLAKETDDVVKARKFKISKSKGALKDIAGQIKTVAVDAGSVITEGGPHKSDHKLLN